MSDTEKTRMQFTLQDIMFEADIYDIDLVGPEEEGDEASLNFHYDIVTPLPEETGITNEQVADQIGKVLVGILTEFVSSMEQREEVDEQN